MRRKFRKFSSQRTNFVSDFYESYNKRYRKLVRDGLVYFHPHVVFRKITFLLTDCRMRLLCWEDYQAFNKLVLDNSSYFVINVWIKKILQSNLRRFWVNSDSLGCLRLDPLPSSRISPHSCIEGRRKFIRKQLAEEK